MSFVLSARSRSRLVGVHNDMQRVVYEATLVTTVEFMVIEGLRTLERHRKMVASGASWTMASRHLTGHAVDVAPVVDGKLRWDWPLFFPLAEAFRLVSLSTGIPVRWGGSWSILTDLPARLSHRDLHPEIPDGPHFELPVRQYPG